MIFEGFVLVLVGSGFFVRGYHMLLGIGLGVVVSECDRLIIGLLRGDWGMGVALAQRAWAWGPSVLFSYCLVVSPFLPSGFGCWCC